MATAPVAPPPIDDLPDPPTTNDPENFDPRMDATLEAQQAMVPQLRAAIANVHGNAASAYQSAQEAAGSASAAALSAISAAANASAAAQAAGAPRWVSGSLYAEGDKREAPSDGRIYRRRAAGGGTVDPKLDPANWALFVAGDLQPVIEPGAAPTLGINACTRVTAPGAWTAQAPEPVLMGDRIELEWDNNRYTNVLNLGARSIKGPTGTVISGALALNAPSPLRLRWWGDYWRAY